MPTVIFDLDGTLADTSADLVAAANACFRRRGFGDQLDPVTDALTAFQGGRAMLRLGYARHGADLGEDAVDADYGYLLEYYGENMNGGTQLYPGVEAALDRLLAAGYRLGICTNKPEAMAETLMTQLGLRDRFGALIGADTLPVSKPDPAPYLAAVEGVGGQLARSLLVGDTDTDRETARAAGVPSILVTFGPGGRSVADLEPDGLLDHYDGIEAEVVRLIGCPD